MKLDLGAGAISPPGFTPLGREQGSEIYPLPYPGESVDEIYASHVLEHFSHRQLEAVLKDWVRTLKKGGRIRIAVPDFEMIAQELIAGKPQPYEYYVMGGQVDKNDFHKSIFTYKRLRELLANLDLVLVRRWKSEIDDCAAYPISLNLEGYKPHVSELRVSGAMSVPRLGFMDNLFCCMEAVIPCQVKLRKHGGAFWGQSMTKVFERILEEDKPDAILTIDYDSIFEPKHLAHLMQLMMLYPEADALAPIQSSRHLETALFTVKGTEGDNAPRIPRQDFAPDIKQVSTAHFGLTLLRANKIRELPKPWFHSQPSERGDWGDGHVDEDIVFWRKWEETGNTLYLANRVAIGHMELLIKWPDENLHTFHQSVTDFQLQGTPEDVWQ